MFVAYSNKYKAGIDLRNVLSFPLAPVSIPLSTAVDAIRKTEEGKLFEAAISDLDLVSEDTVTSFSTLH